LLLKSLKNHLRALDHKKNFPSSRKNSGLKGLRFLLDTGAEVSLIKSPKLISTTEFDPSERVRVKCVDGSIVETHGTVSACLSEGERKVHLNFS
jgi:predicted aspartyl protease